MCRYLFITLLLISTFTGISQPPGKKNLFRSPVDFGMYLSGTFGELRGGHFHAGIDIKTYEQTGKAVKMIADGYISRIKISSTGYGKTLYVTHRNGYTSVFAHLRGFNRTITDYAEKIQKDRKRYTFDVSVPKDRLYYRRGNIIGYSGNSGYSFGPHIHFEIRDTKSQKPVNPLQFGFKVKDKMPPKMRYLKVYDADGGIAYRLDHQSPGHYTLPAPDTLQIAGNVSFGVEAIDMLDGAPNQNGVYSMKVFKNDTLKFFWKADAFSFYETRYINAFIDYAEYVSSGRKFMQTRRLPNNSLSMYHLIEEEGSYTTLPGELATWKIRVADFRGNASEVSFVTKTSKALLRLRDESIADYVLSPFHPHTIAMHSLEVKFPENSFYDSVPFSIERKGIDTLNTAYKIGDRHFPVHRRFSLITDSIPYPDSLHSKALWGIYNEDDQELEPVSSTLSDNKLIATPRRFGLYTMTVDTVPPEITWPPLSKAFAQGDTLTIAIEDDFSGVMDYALYLNKEWVIAEYDAKNDALIYVVKDSLPAGEHTLRCIANDYKDNETVSEQMVNIR